MEHTSWYRRSRHEAYASYQDAYFKARELQPPDYPQACPACIPPGTISERFPWLTTVEAEELHARARAWFAKHPLR